MHQDVSLWRTGSIVMLLTTISYRYLYLLVGLDNGNVAHNIDPVICFLTKAKWPKI